MRYLLAMIFGIGGALLVTLYLSTPIASYVVGRYSFDNPDDVANLHSALFLGVNLVGLLIGWTVGWAIGGGLGLGKRR